MPIPRTDDVLVNWYTDFAARLAVHATALGLSQADVAAVQADSAMLHYLIRDLVTAYSNAFAASTAYKKIIKDGPIGVQAGVIPPAPTLPAAPAVVPAGIVPRLRQLIARIKAAPGYTEAIGADLGIVGPDTSPSAPDKPTGKAIPLDGSRVRIEFNKAGFDGVQVESRYAGETVWQRLGTDNFSPYVDERPPVAADKPEVREYRLRFISRDEPVGDWSDIITATATP
ncbi:MAG TPA: hypothetical protein VJ866_04780 [Pyrinomonadaceae bacterium]|nr:hypothetical protein [Pyrinomonadaceae bacterium]